MSHFKLLFYFYLHLKFPMFLPGTKLGWLLLGHGSQHGADLLVLGGGHPHSKTSGPEYKYLY